MRTLTTRFLLTCAAIGTVFGVVAIGTTYTMAAVFALAPAFSVLFSGYFVMPGVVAQALLRRPGSAILTHVFAALIALPFTPPGFASGPVLLVNGIVLELVFALGAYRYWRAWVHYLAAVVFAAISSAGMIALFAADRQPAWVLVLAPVLLLVADLLAVWLARTIAAGVARAGVGAGLALPVDRRRRVRRVSADPVVVADA